MLLYDCPKDSSIDIHKNYTLKDANALAKRFPDDVAFNANTSDDISALLRNSTEHGTYIFSAECTTIICKLPNFQVFIDIMDCKIYKTTEDIILY